MRRDQRHQLGPGHHQVHLVQELALASPLGLALESAPTQAQLLHGVTVSHRAMAAGVLQTFPSSKTPPITITKPNSNFHESAFASRKEHTMK